jgi:phosphoribosyl 1,2-cyclic phosphodiesterase
MRFASLGSGSDGNGLVVEAAGTCVLIDCGFGVKDTVWRLGRLGLEPSSISAILVTHEHGDHISGVPAFAARYEIPVWATFGTLAEVSIRFEEMTQVYAFDSHDHFAIGALEIMAVRRAARRA